MTALFAKANRFMSKESVKKEKDKIKKEVKETVMLEGVEIKEEVKEVIKVQSNQDKEENKGVQAVDEETPPPA